MCLICICIYAHLVVFVAAPGAGSDLARLGQPLAIVDLLVVAAASALARAHVLPAVLGVPRLAHGAVTGVK